MSLGVGVNDRHLDVRMETSVTVALNQNLKQLT